MSHLKSLSYFDYYQILDHRQEPSLVCFTKPSCGGCRRLKKILNETPLKIPGLQCFDVLVEDSYGLVEEFEIFHLPTMLLYVQGQYHCEVNSRLTRHDLEEAITLALQRPAEESATR